ncbi:hypothetical protein D9M68_951870 [compost metagenome]
MSVAARWVSSAPPMTVVVPVLEGASSRLAVTRISFSWAVCAKAGAAGKAKAVSSSAASGRWSGRMAAMEFQIR